MDYGLTQEEYDLFIEAAQFKMDELGLDHQDPMSLLKVIKAFGKAIGNPQVAAVYVDEQKAKAKAELKTRLEAQLEAL